MRHVRSWIAIGTAIAVGGAVALAAAPAQAAAPKPLAASRPAWAVPANRVGPVDGRRDVVVRVYLRLRDQATLESIAKAVSDPDNAQYGHYLTPADVRTRFAPTAGSITAVRSWLSANGLRLLGEPANGLYVEAMGSAAKISKAFTVSLSRYRVRGKELRAPDGDLSVPASLAPVVSGVIGVDESQALFEPSHVASDSDARKPAPPSAGFRNGRPCSAYWGEKLDTTDPAYGRRFANPLPYAPCGYTPPQLRSAYGIASTVDAGHAGASATVAVIDAFASPTIYQDAAEYASRNDPTHPLTQAQFSQLIFPTNTKLQSPNQCDASGWYGEETLDVEAVHAMAPDAKILYVGASDCEDRSLDKALNDVVANDRARIITNSYGDLGEDIAPDEVKVFDSIVLQGAAQGIGIYFASGDDGDEAATLGHVAADFPGTDPWVTAVGGTSLGVNQSGGVALETGWETGFSALADGTYDPPAPGAFLYGSGGGTSVIFAQPDYQKGVVPNKLANANGKPAARVVPDISMLGDPNTGMLVGQTQKFKGEKPVVKYDEYRIGGTSLSSPLLAGLIAVADDLAGHPHGFINPAIYGKTRKAHGIRDIQHVVGADVRVDFNNGFNDKKGTHTTVRTFDFQGLAISSRNGYDTVTGLGVPAGLAFLQNL